VGTPICASARLRTFDGQHRGGFARVFQRHVVGDDVLPDVLKQLAACFRFSVDEQSLVETKDIRIGLNAALRAQKERIAALARCELLDVIGRDGVQEARAILAGNEDHTAAAQIEPGRAGAQSVVAGGHAFSVRCGGRADRAPGRLRWVGLCPAAKACISE
jgi:hypothetical protein